VKIWIPYYLSGIFFATAAALDSRSVPIYFCILAIFFFVDAIIKAIYNPLTFS
jgi:hypothetical protein